MKEQESWLSRHITLHSYQDEISEKENSISHAIGSALSLIFLITVLFLKGEFVSHSTYVGMVIFAISQLILFTSSAIYHKVEKGDIKRLFRIFDHSTIYFLIAGTYTPIMLFINSASTQIILMCVYLFLVAGVLSTIFFWGKFKVLHVLLYLFMGWSIVLVWNEVVPNLPGALISFVIAAGIQYTVGVLFYALKKMNHAHLIWHIFCLTASATFSVGFLIYFI
jgi:hemolysin III